EAGCLRAHGVHRHLETPRGPELSRRLAWVIAVALVGLGGCFLQPKRALLHPPTQAVPAPPVYRVTFTTTKGPFVIEVHRAWAPRGADRFYYLTRHGFY